MKKKAKTKAKKKVNAVSYYRYHVLFAAQLDHSLIDHEVYIIARKVWNLLPANIKALIRKYDGNGFEVGCFERKQPHQSV